MGLKFHEENHYFERIFGRLFLNIKKRKINEKFSKDRERPRKTKK